MRRQRPGELQSLAQKSHSPGGVSLSVCKEDLEPGHLDMQPHMVEPGLEPMDTPISGHVNSGRGVQGAEREPLGVASGS